jgi:glycerol-3-phosphate O-acyltransferase / dihydroxyacetone phosphate acyltransferase
MQSALTDSQSKAKYHNNDMQQDKESIPLLYCWTIGFLSIILNLFFRKIETWGSWGIPQKGPVIFVAAPHANQVFQFFLHDAAASSSCPKLIDPVLLSRTILHDSGRPVSNLIPNIWRRMKLVGLLARFLGAITLERPSDFEKRGTGTVVMDHPVSKPCVVRGIGTNFVKEAQVGGLMVLPTVDQRTAVSTIEAIRGPEEIFLKRPFSQPKNAMQQLSVNAANDGQSGFCKTLGSAYKLAPKLDRTKFFESLSTRFDCGKSILIFPEGASHDRPEFIPLNGNSHLEKQIHYLHSSNSLTALSWCCYHGFE